MKKKQASFEGPETKMMNFREKIVRSELLKFWNNEQDADGRTKAEFVLSMRIDFFVIEEDGGSDAPIRAWKTKKSFSGIEKWNIIVTKERKENL